MDSSLYITISCILSPLCTSFLPGSTADSFSKGPSVFSGQWLNHLVRLLIKGLYMMRDADENFVEHTFQLYGRPVNAYCQLYLLPVDEAEFQRLRESVAYRIVIYAKLQTV